MLLIYGTGCSVEILKNLSQWRNVGFDGLRLYFYSITKFTQDDIKTIKDVIKIKNFIVDQRRVKGNKNFPLVGFCEEIINECGEGATDNTKEFLMRSKDFSINMIAFEEELETGRVKRLQEEGRTLNDDELKAIRTTFDRFTNPLYKYGIVSLMIKQVNARNASKYEDRLKFKKVAGRFRAV